MIVVGIAVIVTAAGLGVLGATSRAVAGIHHARRRAARALALAVGLSAALPMLTLCGSAAGATTADASSELLSQLPLSGYIAAPKGPRNGPIDQTNIDLFGGGAGIVGQAQANGDMTSAIRLWTHRPPNGTSVVIFVFRFNDSAAIPSFRAGVAKALSTSSTFAVAKVPGAVGYNSFVSAAGTSARNFTVVFSKGSSAFGITVLTTSDTLTAADATAIASAQYAAAPTTGSAGSSDSAYRTGEVVGGVLLAMFVVALVVAVVQRTSHGRTSGAAPNGLVWDQQVGWHAVAGRGNEQAYWNGQAWTKRRYWTNGVWSEF